MPPEFRFGGTNWKGKDKMKRLFLLSSLLLLWTVMQAQVISGKITNHKNQALVGCNIMVLNNNMGTISDELGAFSLPNLAAGIYHLQVSSLAYETQQIKVVLKEKEHKKLQIQLKKEVFESDEVVVVANKTPMPIHKIPSAIAYISSDELNRLPSQSIDENMKYTSGINVDRPFGIFGKSIVGIRGVVSSEAGRQLTLVDGIPINKSDGGTVNWNRIIKEDINHIEIQKGPGSSMYGNNAMGGIVNIITKRPYKKGVSATANSFYGSYNSYGGSFNVMQKFIEDIKGAYYSVSGKALKSDGYITVPDSLRTNYDTTTFVEEYAINMLAAYKWNYYTSMEFAYNYYDDHRGQGIKIKAEDGMTADHDTHFIKTRFKSKTGRINWDVNAYYQHEKYLKVIEKMKKESYSLIHVQSNRKDYGLILSGNTRLLQHNLSYGIDYNRGSVDAADKYQTSSDIIINKGIMDLYNIYFQDDFHVLKEKVYAIASINYAITQFHSGLFAVENPTGQTDFMLTDAKTLDAKQWSGISPKLALQYNFNPHANAYISASRGFRTATLDDMTRTGFINIGYKLANPNLKPETLDNIELGYRFYKNKLTFNSSAYYSIGKDFMYYVATGESLFGGRKKIYKKQNISQVEIYGLETSLKYEISEHWRLSANYTYSKSEIKKFEGLEEYEGKALSYSPENMANLGVFFIKEGFLSSVFANYKSSQFLTEDNFSKIPEVISVDARLTYTFYKGFGAGINAQNIFDVTYLVSSDQLSLGRFITVELNYRFYTKP